MSASTVPASALRLVAPEQYEAFEKAFGAASGGGASMGVAMLHGFEAVRPLQVVIAKCELELFRKESRSQVFYAWASVIEKDGVAVVDHQGDVWPEADMERAAWSFNARGGAHGVEHENILSSSELVASIPFTKDLQEALGIDLGRVGWLVGFHVPDSGAWSEIEKGNLPMVSIGASGFREAAS